MLFSQVDIFLKEKSMLAFCISISICIAVCICISSPQRMRTSFQEAISTLDNSYSCINHNALLKGLSILDSCLNFVIAFWLWQKCRCWKFWWSYGVSWEQNLIQNPRPKSEPWSCWVVAEQGWDFIVGTQLALVPVLPHSCVFCACVKVLFLYKQLMII